MLPRASRGRVRSLLSPRVVALAALMSLGTIGSVWLAAAVRANEERALERAVAVKATDVVVRVGHELQTRLLAIERMADRWRLADGTPREAWEHDATNYVSHFGGIRAIERVDAEGTIAWVTPPRYEGYAGIDMRKDAARRAAMDEAWRRNRAVVSAPVDLFSGGRGVLVFLPIYDHERFDGWLAGVFAVQELVAATLGPLDGYRLRITAAGGALYSDPRPVTPICSRQALGVFYLGWMVEVCAGPELVEAQHGPLPALALAAGLAFTALASGLFAALLVASDRARRARALAASLREQANALERAQRELAELSWSVSHELRTPLRAIDGYAALLSKDASDEAQPAFARIRANAQRMAHQLDGLLALLRIARANVRPMEVDVSERVRHRLARHLAEEPGRRVEVDVQDGIRVRADPALLGTAIDALVDNAWKFTRARDPGHIRVSRAPGGFCVWDDGVGFDMAFAEKLFGPFERLHAPGEFEGLGLGLALAARAVARHGGRIRAEGQPGSGARFYVELPEPPREGGS